MAIIRSYTQPKAGVQLILHTYIDDAATGGEIVLTSEMVAKDVTPTQSGIIAVIGNDWLIISIKNRDASPITWIEKPNIRGTNELYIDGPVFDDGYVLPGAAIVDGFMATIEAGDEQVIKIDPSLAGYGIMLQAEAPAQDLDLAIYVLSKKGK